MKRKVAIVFVFTGVYLLGFLTYNFFNTDKAIFNRVIKANGYTIQHIGQPDPLEFFVKPEWVPLEKDVKLNVNEKLIESHNTTVVLDEVWNRGGNMSFSFELIFNMNPKEGDFLNTFILNQDGSSTSVSTHIMLYGVQHNEIATNGIGVGLSHFSFGINDEDLDEIRDGFHVVHPGLQLHEYSKK